MLRDLLKDTLERLMPCDIPETMRFVTSIMDMSISRDLVVLRNSITKGIKDTTSAMGRFRCLHTLQNLVRALILDFLRKKLRMYERAVLDAPKKLSSGSIHYPVRFARSKVHLILNVLVINNNNTMI